MDWRHTRELLKAGDASFSELLNIYVWVKHNAGMGSLYRSQHELAFVFKSGDAPHINNVQLGKFGRHRSNTWQYPGVNDFGRGGEEGNLLAMHPTVKPVRMLADAILDCSNRGAVVLDPFLGSGSTLMACERTGMSKDHILVSCVTREGEILNALRRNLPNVRNVHVPHTTCGAFMAIVSIKKTAQGEPQMAVMATLGTELYTKYVIVVHDDVDIFDMNDAMWTIATRVRAEKDVFFIPGAKAAILDPTSDPQDFTVTKMGIDATRPMGRDFAERLVITDEQRRKVREILQSVEVTLSI